jgi:uncharacterized protein YqgC (DUF456 family)
MEIALDILGIIFLLGGLFLSMVPAMPGPVVSYLGMVLVYFAKSGHVMSGQALLSFGIATAVIILIENFIPVAAAKFSGASKHGVYGAFLGTLIGLIFFPPLGALVGAYLGAMIGELYTTFDIQRAADASTGVILGTLAALLIRTLFSLTVLIYVIVKLFAAL